jgi:hypothetical protein
MKTRNLIIYHCLSCGAVMHCEPDQEMPQCCGRPMVKAAAETIASRVGHTPEDIQPSADAISPQNKPR